MHLNLPILDQLLAHQNILIVGMGGGYDIFCGLPVYFELRRLGKTAHLANYSFSLLSGLKDAHYLNENVVGVRADNASWYPYFPELFLTQWFRDVRQEELTVWCFQKTGVLPLLEGYEALIDHLNIDLLLLVDGGVDSLLRGNEAGLGTLLEDSISLCAVNALRTKIPKLMICLGFGAEQDIVYTDVLENIAALSATGDFLGSCALLKQMPCYQAYEQAVLYVHEKQDPSVINASVVSAVRGEFGNYHLTSKTQGSRLWISPLMMFYWCFNLPAVAARNLILSQLRFTESVSDGYRVSMKAIQSTTRRKTSRIPL